MSPRTLFVYRRRGLGSAEVRGVQMAEALDTVAISRPHFTAESAAAYDAVVYVKGLPEPRISEQVRRRGVKQVWDALDDYRWWRIRPRLQHIDAIIGANLTHTLWLRQEFGLPTIELHHHHCNFEELRIPPGRTPPAIGYVASIKPWARNRRLVARLPYRVVSNIGVRGRESLPQFFMSIDIGFQFRGEKDKRSFNAALKVVNFMSYGIPSVLNEESGYLEVARHGEHCLFAQSAAELPLLIRALAEDPAWRTRMGEAGYEAAKPFHIRSVAEQYRSFLASL